MLCGAAPGGFPKANPNKAARSSRSSTTADSEAPARLGAWGLGDVDRPLRKELQNEPDWSKEEFDEEVKAFRKMSEVIELNSQIPKRVRHDAPCNPGCCREDEAAKEGAELLKKIKAMRLKAICLLKFSIDVAGVAPPSPTFALCCLTSGGNPWLNVFLHLRRIGNSPCFRFAVKAEDKCFFGPRLDFIEAGQLSWMLAAEAQKVKAAGVKAQKIDFAPYAMDVLEAGKTIGEDVTLWSAFATDMRALMTEAPPEPKADITLPLAGDLSGDDNGESSGGEFKCPEPDMTKAQIKDALELMAKVSGGLGVTRIYLTHTNPPTSEEQNIAADIEQQYRRTVPCLWLRANIATDL